MPPSRSIPQLVWQEAEGLDVTRRPVPSMPEELKRSAGLSRLQRKHPAQMTRGPAQHAACGDKFYRALALAALRMGFFCFCFWQRRARGLTQLPKPKTQIFRSDPT